MESLGGLLGGHQGGGLGTSFPVRWAVAVEA